MFNVFNQYSAEQVRQNVKSVLEGLGDNLFTDIDLYVTKDDASNQPIATVGASGTITVAKPKNKKVIIRRAASSPNVATSPATDETLDVGVVGTVDIPFPEDDIFDKIAQSLNVSRNTAIVGSLFFAVFILWDM
jgi:hypothetical protein